MPLYTWLHATLGSGHCDVGVRMGLDKCWLDHVPRTVTVTLMVRFNGTRIRLRTRIDPHSTQKQSAKGKKGNRQGSFYCLSISSFTPTVFVGYPRLAALGYICG